MLFSVCAPSITITTMKELNTLQQGSHPFIAHYFGGFETSHCIAVVMEYCYGGELYNRMQQSHKMPESHAMFYFCELALALQHLQGELKMVYRDLKPENVLLDAEGHVKLCDFGFTAPVVVSDSTGLAPLTDGCGTVMYMAPELAERKSNHSFPVDWWALGVMTYEMVVGKPPFGSTDNKSKFEVFNNITEKAVSIPMSVSYSLAAMLRGLLDKDPRKRFSWDEVRTSSWLQAVDWDLVEGRRIAPPWIPSAVDQKPGTSQNFIEWDFKLPGGAPLPSNVRRHAALVNCSACYFGLDSVGHHVLQRDQAASWEGDLLRRQEGVRPDAQDFELQGISERIGSRVYSKARSTDVFYLQDQSHRRFRPQHRHPGLRDRELG